MLMILPMKDHLFFKVTISRNQRVVFQEGHYCISISIGVAIIIQHCPGCGVDHLFH